jgi:molybdopterin converting factor small subunit
MFSLSPRSLTNLLNLYLLMSVFHSQTANFSELFRSTVMAIVPKPPAGHFNVLYFASAGSYTNKEFESLPAPLPLKKLFETLEDRYKGIKAHVLDSSLVTVNLEYVDVPRGQVDETRDDAQLVIKEGDDVAIIPPVSSG